MHLTVVTPRLGKHINIFYKMVLQKKKRMYSVKVYLAKEEYNAVKKKADSMGYSISGMARMLLLKVRFGTYLILNEEEKTKKTLEDVPPL